MLPPRSARSIMQLWRAMAPLLRRVPRPAARRMLSEEAAKEPAQTWWNSAQFWGGLGALAGWGMTGSAIYDASLKGPEIIIAKAATMVKELTDKPS